MVSLATRIRDLAAVLTGRAYEAAQGTAQNLNRPINAAQSADAANEQAGTALTAWGRHLDENHDLAIGILDDLATNVVGTGIVVEPMPRIAGRESDDLAERILDLWDDWSRTPEVTGEIALGELQRLSCRSWLRDGEFFAQHVGRSAVFSFEPDVVPYRVEYLESEMVPRDLWIEDENYRQGVWLNAWRAPIEYAVYRENPHDFVHNAPFRGTLADVKRVPADRMMHCKFTRRWPQTRGVPILHGVLRRLDNIKDYEQSEQVAARIAASMSAYIRKSPDNVRATPGKIAENASGERQLRFQAGMIFDDLLPGEEIGMIDSSRPNPELANFRASQLRAVAAGTGARYSSIAKDYNGTYSAQRQELVEAWPHYKRLRDHYVASFLRPMYERWLLTAYLSGMLPIAGQVNLRELMRAEFIGPGMGWIDPKKEVEAYQLAEQAGYLSRNQIIRMMGNDPRKVAVSSERQPALSVVEESEEDEDEVQGSEAADA